MLKAARGCAYVSQFYAAFIEGDSHYMVMEFVPGGDLLKTVQQCMAAKVCVNESINPTRCNPTIPIPPSN